MSERGIYTAMNSERATMLNMRIATNNLANANTPGFRADYPIISEHAVAKGDNNARSIPYVAKTYADFEQGAIAYTGNPLDVAIKGKGFFSVQNQDGQEGYTRAGNFRTNQDGLLTTSKGALVLGIDGPITIPHSRQVSINKEGMVLALPLSGGEKDMQEVGRLKLVDPKESLLEKGEDGLFYMPNNGRAESSESVDVVAEYLEGSNVNTVRTLVELIDVSRRFEFSGKMSKSFDENSYSCNKLLENLV